MCSGSFPRCTMPMVLGRCKSVELQLLQQSWTQMIYIHRGFFQLSLWIEQLSAWLYILKRVVGKKALQGMERIFFLPRTYLLFTQCSLVYSKSHGLALWSYLYNLFLVDKKQNCFREKEVPKPPAELGCKIMSLDAQESPCVSVLLRLNLLMKPILDSFVG